MALIPLLSELLDDHRRPSISDLYDQHFGLGLWNNDTLRPTSALLLAPLRSGYLRPWRNLEANSSGVSAIHNDKNEFKVSLDVQQFKPEELKVKVADGFVVIDGKHEERSDEHGFISRQFTRKYKLPKDVDEAKISSTLSSDGVLVLKAPKRPLPEPKGREIEISRSNEPALKQKKTEKVEKMEQ